MVYLLSASATRRFGSWAILGALALAGHGSTLLTLFERSRQKPFSGDIWGGARAQKGRW